MVASDSSLFVLLFMRLILFSSHWMCSRVDATEMPSNNGLSTFSYSVVEWICHVIKSTLCHLWHFFDHLIRYLNGQQNTRSMLKSFSHQTEIFAQTVYSIAKWNSMKRNKHPTNTNTNNVCFNSKVEMNVCTFSMSMLKIWYIFTFC